MIDTTFTVHEAFFGLFGTAITVPGRDGPLTVPVMYARESAQNFSEGRPEQYPMVSIQDYAPEDDKMMWSVSGATTFEAIPADATSATVYGDESLYKFRYDVATATKDFMQSQAIYSWFMRTFPRWGHLIIDGTRYTMNRESRDVERSDGVFEHTHEFTLEIWFDGQLGVAVPLVQSIATTITPKQS